MLSIVSTCICTEVPVPFHIRHTFTSTDLFPQYVGIHIASCRICGLHKTIVPEGTPFTPTASRSDYYNDHEDEIISGFQVIVNHVRQYLSRGSILDVGCSSGILLSVFNSCGYEVAGIEPNKNAYHAAIKRLPGRIVHGTLPERLTDLPRVQFDIVVYNHVMEHIPDIHREFEAIRTVLKPGGLLIIGVPNIHNMVFAIRGKYWESLMPLEHVWHFDKKHVVTMLRHYGFIPEAVYYENHKRTDYPFVKKLYFSILTAINNILRTGEAVTIVSRLDPKKT